MKIAVTVVTVLIGLLSIAAGVAKIALVPEEVEFLSQFGFNTVLTMIFGTVQVLGGVLLIITKTRFYGSVIATVAFALSAALLLAAGNQALAGASLIPVLLAGLIAYKSLPARPAVEENA